MLVRILHLYKQAYSGLSAATWWLSLVMLVNRSGTMVIPFMTIYLTQRLHYSIAQAGYVMGLFGAGSIAGALMGGKLTDRIGYYPVQLITLAGGGCMFIVLGQMNQYWLICLFTFLLSVVNEAFRPANAAAVAAYSAEENRVRSFSLNRLAINLGWAFGGALGGFIADHNYSLLFWVDGITNILAAFLLRIFLSPRTQKMLPIATDSDFELSPSPYRDKTYLYFILFSTLFAICFFQLFSTMPVYYKLGLGLSVFVIGCIMSMNGLIIAFVEMVIVYGLEGKRSIIDYIFYGVLLVAASFLIFTFVQQPPILVAVISMLLFTFGEMLAMPFMNSFWISRTSAANRGQYASLYTISYAMGAILGPTLGTQIVQQFGFGYLWLIVGVVCVGTAGLFRLLKN